MRDLNALIDWLEYGKMSGYRAAREPKEQEEHWADLLRDLIEDYEDHSGEPFSEWKPRSQP